MTDRSIKTNAPNGPLPAIASIAIALAAGASGGFATASSVTTWYVHLNKPEFNPPNVVFGPVWTALYVLMALVAWRVWRRHAPDGRRRRTLVLYAFQLVLNLAWSLIFFGLRKPGLALVELSCCWSPWLRQPSSSGALLASPAS